MLTFFIFLFYYKTIPVSPLVPFTAITSLEISTGIVVLPPESLPSIVIVVNSFVLFPNNEVLLIPVNANEDPIIVSLNAELAKGLLVDV